MNTKKNNRTKNLSSRKLWQIVNTEEPSCCDEGLILSARNELIKRKQHKQNAQFNCPH